MCARARACVCVRVCVCVYVCVYVRVRACMCLGLHSSACTDVRGRHRRLLQIHTKWAQQCICVRAEVDVCKLAGVHVLEPVSPNLY